MNWKHIFAKKDLEMLLAEMAGEHRLRRILGPVSLTSLGVGCIIGAGIFVLTGVAAADYGGPAIILSFAVAAVGCALAALCYAEFAAMAPVAGSVYAYAYTTLGEIFAWIIGWDLILEYSMGTAAVASSWSGYLNEFLLSIGKFVSKTPWQIPKWLLNDPFTHVEGLAGRPWCNLPSVLIMVLVTIILVRGIRESARTNAILVILKVSVVLFVVAIGIGYVQTRNWTSISVAERVLPQDRAVPGLVKEYCRKLAAEPSVERITDELAAAYCIQWARQQADRLRTAGEVSPAVAKLIVDLAATLTQRELARGEVDRAVVDQLLPQVRSAPSITPELVREYLRDHFDNHQTVDGLSNLLVTAYRADWSERETRRLNEAHRPSAEVAAQTNAAVASSTQRAASGSPINKAVVGHLLAEMREEEKEKEAESWGLLGCVGLNRWLTPIDDATRTPFMPYGLSGIMLGASIVFFAFIGFDSISTHAEEARNPQRDVPIGIITSLVLCTILYMAVAAVITGMVPYPKIDAQAPIAVAFGQRAEETHSPVLQGATVLISAGGLAGMTSVLLVLFLSQARVFMAMARDGLLPRVFGEIHPRFRTPHIATMTTGGVICVVAAMTPIQEIAKMVNIGTLLAFVMVCAAVMILRRQRPNAVRPFRCPALWLVGPLGIFVNVVLMLFLPPLTWIRLGIWLVIGLAIYFLYSRHRSHLVKHLLHEIQEPRDDRMDADNGAKIDSSSG